MKSVVCDLEEIHSWTRTYDPFEIAFYLDFEIVYTSKLPDGQLGLAVPELNVIFLANYIKGTRFSYFVCAHELTHGTEHEGIQAFYNCSNRAKGRLEQEADSGAIYILCKYYLETFPDIDQLNITTLANYYDLDESIYPLIEKELKEIMEEQK